MKKYKLTKAVAKAIWEAELKEARLNRNSGEYEVAPYLDEYGNGARAAILAVCDWLETEEAKEELWQAWHSPADNGITTLRDAISYILKRAVQLLD